MGKNWNNERFIWKSSGIWAFESLIQAYGGLNLDLFYTVIFLEELQKINRRVLLLRCGHTLIVYI
jgi:hypothetical protein